MESQMTLTEQGEMFGGLYKKALTIEEKGVRGAKIFRNKIGGIFGTKKRTSSEMVQLLRESNLATDSDSAEEVLNSLKGKSIVYGGILRDSKGDFYDKPCLAKYFRLEKLENDETLYRVHSWNTLPN